MRLGFVCTACVFASADPDGVELHYLPISATGLYRFTCQHGHTNIMVVQQMLFEVLAETAVQAILDGYFRDAVSSFSASLERFYQHYVEVVLLAKLGSGAAIEATWKHVARQSERQLGMFYALFAHENGASPPVLAERFLKLRNDVVHSGHIPVEAEAIAYGQAVVDLVQPLLPLLHHRYNDAVDALLSLHMISARRGLTDQEQRQVGTTFQPMVFNYLKGEAVTPAKHRTHGLVASSASSEGGWPMIRAPSIPHAADDASRALDFVEAARRVLGPPQADAFSDFPMLYPTGHLIAHAIELGLGAYLRAEKKKGGLGNHDLIGRLEAAEAAGFSPSPMFRKAVIAIDASHRSMQFRYSKDDTAPFPTPRAIIPMIEADLERIRQHVVRIAVS